MNHDPAARQRRHRLLLTASLFTTAALALAHLPARVFPPVWIAAFTAPAVLFLLLSEVWPRHILVRLLLATLFQVCAAKAALDHAGPLAHAPALACTLLPPLTYVVLRRQHSDIALGLFLSFCLALVGTMLQRGDPGTLTVAFVVAAALTLRLETRTTQLLARPRFSGSREPALQRHLRPLSTAALCAAVSLLAFRALEFLPVGGSPDILGNTANAPVATTGDVEVGLADDFRFARAQAISLDLGANQLVQVSAIDGDPVPADLYLRIGSFDRPGLDGWEASPVDLEHKASWKLRNPSGPVRQYEIESLDDEGGAVYLPPRTVRLEGPPGLVGDARTGTFQMVAQRARRVEVEVEAGPAPVRREPVEPGWEHLTALPAELGDGFFRSLPRELGVPGRGSPRALAAAIAEGLGRHCRYELKTPSGPYDHALLNFLDGNRHGYCMHFASAAAILLRQAGVPCRIGVGLYGGEASPGDRAIRIYGSRHAHAWVEIPYRGHGWVVFDPTPPHQRALGSFPENDPTLDDTFGEDTGAGAGGLLSWLRLGGEPWLWLVLVLVGGVAFVRPRRRRSARSTLPPAQRPARRMLLELLKVLARRGLDRRRGQTLEAFARELRAREVPAVATLAAAFAAYQEIRFGGHALDAERIGRLGAGLAAAEEIPRKDDGSS